MADYSSVPAGAAGNDGATGQQGTPGTPGQDGEDGQFGVPGAAGAAGAQGAQGDPGAAGDSGAQGVPGLPGEDADSFLPVPPPEITKLQGFPGGSTFLRADGTFAAPAGAPPAGTTVEVNLGSAMVHEGKFTITDAGISAASKVMCWQAPGPYTGKGTRADEAAMAPVRVLAVEPAAGSAVVRWDSSQGFTPVTNGPLGFRTAGAIAATRADQYAAPSEVLGVRARGMVRGNVKFSYVVFA